MRVRRGGGRAAPPGPRLPSLDAAHRTFRHLLHDTPSRSEPSQGARSRQGACRRGHGSRLFHCGKRTVTPVAPMGPILICLRPVMPAIRPVPLRQEAWFTCCNGTARRPPAARRGETGPTAAAAALATCLLAAVPARSDEDHPRLSVEGCRSPQTFARPWQASAPPAPGSRTGEGARSPEARDGLSAPSPFTRISADLLHPHYCPNVRRFDPVPRAKGASQCRRLGRVSAQKMKEAAHD